jgi:gamma-glutamylcyclotransferase (GGCT)/AIG2-like uncharacterized protein YtfP
MTDYLFVYGTLKEGGINHSCLFDCKFIDSGVCPNSVLADLGAFPGLVFTQDTEHVKGEIYQASNIGRSLQLLDYLEGNGRLFERVCADITANSGIVYPCWVYTWMRGLQQPTLEDWDV